MAWKDLLTILVTVLTSAGVFGFIQFLISRADKKKDKMQDILDTLDDLAERFAERDARIARESILRFDDELVAGVRHSREYFRVILEDDVDSYEKYCAEHEDFKNSFTAEAVKHIRKVYGNLLDNGEFKSA